VFYLNNFFNNTENVEKYITDLQEFPTNIWDNGTIGNYWSDYEGLDSDEDGIGDTPYIINENNQDNHPLMNPSAIPEFPSWLILPLFLIATFSALVVKKRITSKT
jgi:nitrous oxidase accessory protein NosD